MEQFNVIVNVRNRKYKLTIEKNKNLLELLQEKNINISSPCGGNKSCGKCKVIVSNGRGSLTKSELDLLSKQDISNNYRLACCVEIKDNMVIEVVEEGQLQVMTGGINLNLNYDPAIKSYNLKKAEIVQKSAYLNGILQKTSTEQIAINSLKEMANIIDKEDIFLLKLQEKIIAVKDKPFNKVYGLAVDIGTTTVAVYLMDLLTGKEVDVFSFHNPQKKFGADVISRINYTQKESGALQEMQGTIVSGLNQAITELTIRNKIDAGDIYQLAAVGNTIMLHFLLGINPGSIAKAPYTPVFTNTMEISPGELKVNINPAGLVQILPSVSGYIGADIIADLLVTDFTSEDWNLVLDIGTNGEIVLGNNQQILTCSAAAGPAFEGAKITFGMAGVPGAISKFSITDDGQVEYETIASRKPAGICGSGLVDIIAELLDKKLLNSTGAFNRENNIVLKEYLTTYKNMPSFKVIDENILLTQKDVREFQLAKGAIAAGINILLKEAGIGFEDIKRVYLAGGFGSFIDPVNACKIGLLPSSVEDRIIRIGNGAGLGARAYLLDKQLKEKAELLLNKIKYIELSLRKDFQDEFMNSMEF